jgi:hypothetical protein
MVASLLVVVAPTEHEVLLLETFEIVLFTAFWVVQTREQWTAIQTIQPDGTVRMA